MYRQVSVELSVELSVQVSAQVSVEVSVNVEKTQQWQWSKEYKSAHKNFDRKKNRNIKKT